MKKYLMMRLIEVEDQEWCHQTWFNVDFVAGCHFKMNLFVDQDGTD